jgi:hypothetical protein
MLTNPEWVLSTLKKWRKPVRRNHEPGLIRDRLRIMAECAAAESSGDFLEIGANVGETTAVLLRIAKEWDRRVIVIDPWEIGTQNCNGGEFQKFTVRTAPWRNFLTVLRMRSDDPVAVKTMKDATLCFSFVDGLHEYETCLNDIRNVLHSYLIVVDDTWYKDIAKALKESTDRRIVTAHDLFIREGYILPEEE